MPAGSGRALLFDIDGTLADTDALHMEAAGVPSTLVITAPFAGHVTSWAVTMGAPGYHFAVVPHPVSSRAPDILLRYAAAAANSVFEHLTAQPK